MLFSWTCVALVDRDENGQEKSHFVRYRISFYLDHFRICGKNGIRIETGWYEREQKQFSVFPSVFLKSSFY